MKFEEALRQLETIVEQLESNELSLDQSLQLFEEGITLSGFCRNELDQAEGKVQKLIQGESGALELIDWE